MDKNKKLDDLPEDKTTRAFECISMDGFHTDGGENGLAIIDMHTGYIWARKTGEKATGTASVILSILTEALGNGFNLFNRFKMDGGKNLLGGVIEEISETLKIWQDNSSHITRQRTNA